MGDMLLTEAKRKGYCMRSGSRGMREGGDGGRRRGRRDGWEIDKRGRYGQGGVGEGTLTWGSYCPGESRDRMSMR